MTNESERKLKTLALIIKFGHDLFAGKDVGSIAAAAVNDSHVLLNFRNAAVFRLSENKKCNVLGQFGQAEVNEFSTAVVQQKKLISNTVFDKDNIAILSSDKLPEELAADNAVYLLCRLPMPAAADLQCSYVWLLEYEKSVPETAVTTAQLLGKSMAEALCLAEASRAGSKRKLSRFAGNFIKISCVVLLLAAGMFIRIRESATAEFMLKAPDVTAAYAWFDGQIAKCLKEDGDIVRKDEVVVVFDTAELNYRLANAQSSLKEAETALELAQQTAFSDESKLGKVKLLQAKCNILQVTVNEVQWYLKNSVIKSRSDGILVLSDGRAREFAGKAVKSGDKLFEVYGGSGMIAEIMVNERNSSILQEKFDAEMFLHTTPEKGITGKIISVAGYPVLNEQNLYCYTVRVQLPEDAEKKLRFGMRGVARLSGKKVSLWYYLFKNLIVYFRNW